MPVGGKFRVGNNYNFRRDWLKLTTEVTQVTCPNHRTRDIYFLTRQLVVTRTVNLGETHRRAGDDNVVVLFSHRAEAASILPART